VTIIRQGQTHTAVTAQSGPIWRHDLSRHWRSFRALGHSHPLGHPNALGFSRTLSHRRALDCPRALSHRRALDHPSTLDRPPTLGRQGRADRKYHGTGNYLHSNVPSANHGQI
jgi:hypothetical protein